MKTSRESVWKLANVRPKTKLFLLALVDHADISDTICNDWRKISIVTGLRPDFIQFHIQALEDLGFVELIGRHVTLCGYEIERQANAKD